MINCILLFIIINKLPDCIDIFPDILNHSYVLTDYVHHHFCCPGAKFLASSVMQDEQFQYI